MKQEKKFKQEVEHILASERLATKKSSKGSFKKKKEFKSLIVNKSIWRNVQLVNKIFELIQINMSIHYLFRTFGQYPYIIICMCIRDKLHPHDACKKH